MRTGMGGFVLSCIDRLGPVGLKLTASSKQPINVLVILHSRSLMGTFLLGIQNTIFRYRNKTEM